MGTGKNILGGVFENLGDSLSKFGLAKYQADEVAKRDKPDILKLFETVHPGQPVTEEDLLRFGNILRPKEPREPREPRSETESERYVRLRNKAAKSGVKSLSPGEAGWLANYESKAGY